MYDLSYFDKIICLCVDVRCNEWARIDREFAQYGGKVQRFVVGKGKMFSPDKYDMIDKDVPAFAGNTVNAHNCYLSHRAILEECRVAGYDKFLLLEDDVTLLDGFGAHLNSVIQQLEEVDPDWDMLNLGNNITWGLASQVAPNLLRLHQDVYCWHAIALRQKLIEPLLALPEIGPFDLLSAQQIQPKYKCYGVWPVLARQLPGFSSVMNSVQNYNLYFDNKGNNIIV